MHDIINGLVTVRMSDKARDFALNVLPPEKQNLETVGIDGGRAFTRLCLNIKNVLLRQGEWPGDSLYPKL